VAREVRVQFLDALNGLNEIDANGAIRCELKTWRETIVNGITYLMAANVWINGRSHGANRVIFFMLHGRWPAPDSGHRSY
jgi:hypothetical protein